MLPCCRNSSNTAQNTLRNGKCALNFIDDKRAQEKTKSKLPTHFPNHSAGDGSLC